MSRSDSPGAGRRRSRRGAPARAPRERYEADNVRTDPEAEDDGHHESREPREPRGRRGGRGSSGGGRGRGRAPSGGRKNVAARRDPDPAEGRSGHSGGSERSGRSERGGRRGSPAPSRGRRSARSSPGADPVSKFSASALRRVSVLGDRPSQVVYTLAEQSRRKRGTTILASLLVLCVTALVALLGVLGYRLATESTGGTAAGSSGSVVSPPEDHSSLVPRLYQAQPQDDAFEPIAERGDGSGTLPKDKLFGSDTEKLELDGQKLVREQAEVTEKCTSLVWGEQVAQSLVDGECTSAGTAVYLGGDDDYIVQFTLFDMADADAAAETSAALDPGGDATAPGFLLPQKDGVDGLHKGYSQATAQVMGHYLAVYWVARTDGAEPGDGDTLSTLNVAAMNASTWVYRQVGETGQ